MERRVPRRRPPARPLRQGLLFLGPSASQRACFHCALAQIEAVDHLKQEAQSAGQAFEVRSSARSDLGRPR
jgi:hypothetical protein